MTKKKIKMEVGKRYKGYGILNEYGEYTFEPCQVVENPKNMKIVHAQGNATIYESERFYKISVKVAKNIGIADICRQTRKIENMTPTGLYIIDIDHISKRGSTSLLETIHLYWL